MTGEGWCWALISKRCAVATLHVLCERAKWAEGTSFDFLCELSQQGCGSQDPRFVCACQWCGAVQCLALRQYT